MDAPAASSLAYRLPGAHQARRRSTGLGYGIAIRNQMKLSTIMTLHGRPASAAIFTAVASIPPVESGHFSHDPTGVFPFRFRVTLCWRLLVRPSQARRPSVASLQKNPARQGSLVAFILPFGEVAQAAAQRLLILDAGPYLLPGLARRETRRDSSAANGTTVQ